MKKMKKILIVIITIAILIHSLLKIGYLMRPVETDFGYTQIDTFHSLPSNTVEVMIYGSSHAYLGCSSMEMYDKYGIGAYNYGWNWQKINTIKLFIEDSLLTQKPKVALIETYTVNTVLENVDMNAEIYYSRYLNNKKAIKEYIKQCFGLKIDRYLSYFFPIIQFHDNWNELTARNFNKLSNENFHLINMGFGAIDSIKEIEFDSSKKFTQKELSYSARKVLDDIVKLCKDNDIKIVFFTVPFADDENAYSEAMKKYSKENNCVYIDFFEKCKEIGIDEKKDFCNENHLNVNGAKKISNYLGDYLIKNYNLTDMREIKNNNWEYAKKVSNNLLK